MNDTYVRIHVRAQNDVRCMYDPDQSRRRSQHGELTGFSGSLGGTKGGNKMEMRWKEGGRVSIYRVFVICVHKSTHTAVTRVSYEKKSYVRVVWHHK